MTPSEKLYLETRDKYIRAYELSNNKKIIDIKYEKGFVHLCTNVFIGYSKIRASKFKEMCNVLELRVINKNKKN